MADTLYDRLLAIRKQQLGQDEESNSRSEEALHSYLDNARKQRENQILAAESAERGRQRVEAQRTQEWLQNRTPSTPQQVAQGQIYAGDYAHGNLPQVSAAQAWKNKYNTSAQDTMQRTDLTPEQRMIATENKYASMIPAPTLPENPTDEQKTAYTRQVFARDALVKNAAQTTRKNDILNKSTPQYQEKQSEEERLAQSRLDLGQYEIEGLKDLKSRYQGQLRTYRGVTAENANGRLSPQETMAQIRDIDERIAQKTKDYAAQQKSLNNQIAERKLYPYLALQYNSDFADKSKANPNVTDRDYLRINSPDRYRREVDYEPLYALTKDYLEQLTDEQKGIYNYVYNTQGAEEAQKYIDVLQPVLESKANTASLQRAQEIGKEHPILANAATVLMSPLRGAGAIGEALNQALGNPVRENAIYNRPNTMISGARAGSDSRLRDAVSGQLDKTGASEGVKSWITDAVSALNQGTLSSLDSAWAGLLGQNMASSMFGGLGFQDARSILKAAEANPNLVSSGRISQDLLTKAKRVSKFAEESTRIIMGMQTVPDAIVNAKKRGLTDDQAFQLGMLSGAFEWATEEFSIENLFNTEWTGNTLREFLKKNATQRAFEGSEEISSGLLNTIADVLIAGDKSEWRQSISEYKRLNPGMSDNEAFARALWDKTVEIGGEGLVAFLTTGNEIAVQLAEQEVYNAKTNKVHGVVTNSDKKNNTSNAQTIDNIIAEAINKSDADAASDLADVSNIMKSAYPKGSTINRTIDYIRETARRSPTATEAMRYEGLADYMEKNKESISKLANSRYNGENIAVETEDQTTQNAPTETVQETAQATPQETVVDTQRADTATEGVQNALRTTQNDTNALTAGENTTTENAAQNTATEGSDTRNGRQTFLDSMGLSEESTVEDAARQLYRDINANPDNYVANKGLRNPGAVTDRRGLVNSIAAKQVDMLNAMRNSGEYTAAQIQEATETAQAIDKELRSITQGNVESGVRALNAMFRKAGLDVDVVVDPSEATNYETGNLADRAYYDPRDGKVHVSGYMDTNSALMGVVAHEIFHKAANGTVRKQLVNDILKAKSAIIASNDKSDRYGISKATHSAVLNTGVGDFVDTYSDKLMNTFGLTAEGQTAVQNRMNEQGMSLGEAMKSLANENEKSFWSMFNTSSEGTAQDYIEEEMAAHFIEQLGSQNGEAIMRELIRDNRSLLEKIIDAIKSVFNKNPNVQNSATYKRIINAYERIAAEESGRQVQKIKGTSNENLSDSELQERVENQEPLSTSDEVKASRVMDAQFYDNAVNKNRELQLLDPNDTAMWERLKEVRASVKKALDDVEVKASLPDDVMGDTAFGNSSYGTSEENTSVCPRTVTIDSLTDQVAEDLGRPLTVEESVYIAQEAFNYTDMPQCLYCYVAMDRIAKRALLGDYIDKRKQVYAELDNGVSREDAFDNYKKRETKGGKQWSQDKEDRFNRWYDHYVNGTPVVSLSDMASERAVEHALADPELAEEAKDAMDWAQSASWAKKKVGFAAYNGHILNWSQDRINDLNSMFGLRMYSFSDYSPAYILENMQMVTDAAVRGLKMLAYTKELDFVRIFAGTGMNINISVFGMNDGKGGVVQDGMQGADWEESKKLRQQYPNVGCTFVATNDEQVEWALAQDWIDVVIPFHMVKTGAKVADIFGYHNYTGESSDQKIRAKKGETAPKATQKEIFPNQHQNNKEKYLAALKEANLTPRFNRWINNPNYMKLVNETRRSAQDTPAVRPVFDEKALTAALNSIDTMVKRGGYNVPIGGSLEVQKEIAEEISAKISAGIAKNLKIRDGRVIDSVKERKSEQFELIQKNNPAEDDIHTWIRSVDDIKTFEEALDEDGVTDSDVTPDFTASDVQKALDTGKIKVFSSKKIDPNSPGAFVSPSREEAKNYAGNGKVYTKTVPVEDIAWIDSTQGQYAPVEKNSADKKKTKASRDISEEDQAAINEYNDALAAKDEDWLAMVVDMYAYRHGYTVGAYHGSPVSDITEFNTRSDVDKKQQLQLLFGTHFTRNKSYAEMYAKKAKNSKGTSRMTTKQNGRVYDVLLDLGKSLDLEHARNYDTGSEMFNLYNDLPANIKKKVPVHTYTENDASEGVGKVGEQYINTGDMERALQEMTPKQATDFLVNHKYNSVLYTARYFNGMPGVYSKDPSIIMLDPNRIKSGDPVTRDKDGKVIPLNERFNDQSNDIRYSREITPEMDEEYMAAVESGDTEKQQRMVDDAAKEAGYDIKAYHGTTADFTVFSRERSGQNYDGYLEYGTGFYFTPDENDARNWGEPTEKNSDTAGKSVNVMSVYLSSDSILDVENPVQSGAWYLMQKGVSKKKAKNIAEKGYRFIHYLQDIGYTNEQLQEALITCGYDAVKDIGEGNRGQYVVFDPTQIKSADPVTYDNDGNPIPLSERFNADSPDIRYSRELDDEYMTALENDDEAEEERIIREAARAAGYNSPKLFHGTDAFGFTEIDNTAPGADGYSFWAANRADISGTYTKYAKPRRIASEITDDEYEETKEKVDKNVDDALYEFRRLIDKTFSEWYFGQGDDGLREKFDNANPEPGMGDGIYDEFVDIIYDAFDRYRDELETEYDEYEWLDESEEGKALMEVVLDLESLRGEVAELENGIDGGIYELYANTDNMYELDAKGSLWNELKPEGLPDLGRPYKTRDVANWARKNGYDGVIFRNIRDNGKYGRVAPGDVYAFFHPQAQVKSADPVTYDENGDPIPLSERFDPNNTDIRFSRAVTAEEDAEYMEAVKSGDMDKAAQMVQDDAERSGFGDAIPEQASAYTLRTKAAPKKTVKVYKVFTVAPDGSPTALFVSSATKLPQNVWLEAVDTWHFTADNGQQYIPSTKNPYTKGGKTGASVPIPNEEIRQELIKRGYLPKNSKAKNITALAYRPGWHAGDLPFFPQGGMEGNPRYTNQGKKNKEFDPSKPETNYENIHRYNQVVFECEMAADTDYTATAQAQEKAKNKNGTVNQRKADLQYLPADGYYKYTTNPTMKDVGNWLISGSLKINRALTQEECDTILAQHGYKPQEWEGGTLDLEKLGYTGEQHDAARKTLAPVTYDDDGNVIPLSQRFNPDVDDVRRSREVKSDDFAVELEREKTELLRAQMVANTALGDGKAINQTAAEDIRARYKDLFGDMIPDEEINRDLMELWNILHRPKRGKEDTAESRLNEAWTYAERVARKWLDETSYENVLKDSIGDEETLKGLQSLYNHLTARRNADSEGYYYIIPDMITAAGSRDAFNEIRKTLNGVKLKGFATKAEAEASGRKSISDLFTELRSDGGEYNSLFTPDETANDFSKLTQIASNYALASEAEQDPYKQIYTGAGVDNTAKVYELANDLLYSWETRANPTAAAKAEQKLREERAKGQERLKQVRERRDELIEEEKQKGQERLDKEKARGEKRLNEEREKAQRRADSVKQNTEKRESAMNERFEATYERMRRSYERDKAKAEEKFDRYVQKVKAKDLRIAERALRGKIAKQLTKINQWLEKPEKKRGKHIPQSLRAPMAKLLEAFGGMKMKNGKQISAERMRQIQAEEMSGTRQFVDDVIQGLKGMGGEDGKNSLVTEMFIQRLSEIANEISTAKMTPISNETALSTEVKTDNEEQADVYYQYLNNVKELLDMAIHAIRDENNVIMNNRAMQLDDLKKELALDIRDRTDRKIKADTPSGSEMLGDILKMGRYGSLSADLMFQLMGDSWYNKIAESFREGQNRQAQHEADYAEFMKELTKFYDIEKSGFYGDFVPVEKNDEQNDQGWLGEVYTVPVKGSDGNTINATRGQIMTLYALWNRPDARRHLENGGACFTNHNGEDYKENTVKNIDQAKFEEITSVLTDEEKKIADGIVNYMSDTVADWGNDVSLYVYGYRLFNEDHYFPMEVADYSLKKTNLDPDREASPLNPSFTKSTTKSIKPLALGNIFEVADNHVRGMSIYNAYGAACNDLDRIINDSEMNQLIRKKLGNGALVYLKDFIQTTGGTKLRTAEDAWASALRRGARFRMNNYKRQAVSFNLSTAVKQGLSAIRAANVIDPKYLASGVLAPGSQQYKAVRDKMQANSGVGYIKSLGYSDTGFGKTIHQLYDPSYINDSGIIRGSLASKEAGRKAIRAYDKLTDAGMFLAGKMDEWTWVNLWNAATKEVTEQNPNLSQKELDAKIAARFNEIIGKTQVVDTALDTAPIMRNRLLQFILPFMNEPTKSAGNLIVAADAFANKKPGSKKQFAKVIGTTVLANMILEPIISALFSMWRDEKDDIGNGFWETFAEKLFGIKDGKTTFKDFVTSGVFGGMWQYPVIQGIYDIIANTLQDYDNTTIDSAAISDTVKAIDNLYQNSGKDPATRTKNQGRLWRDLFETLAADVGIPAKTLRRQFSGAARLLMNTVGSNNLKWEYNKLSYNLENSNARSQKGFYDILARTYKDGDIESYQRMLKELTDIINVSEKSGNPTLINLNTVKDNIEKRGGEIKPGTDLWNTTVQAAFRLDQPVKGWKVENFITKTYVNAEKDGIKDSEADNVMLSMPDSYTYEDENGDDVKMTPAQYDEFTRDVGSLSYKILSELSAPANSKAWNSLTVDQQIYAIDKAYAYSKAKCKSDINPEYSNTQIGKPLMNCMAENASPKAIADAIMGMAENTTTTYDRKKK